MLVLCVVFYVLKLSHFQERKRKNISSKTLRISVLGTSIKLDYFCISDAYFCSLHTLDTLNRPSAHKAIASANTFIVHLNSSTVIQEVPSSQKCYLDRFLTCECPFVIAVGLRYANESLTKVDHLWFQNHEI